MEHSVIRRVYVVLEFIESYVEVWKCFKGVSRSPIPLSFCFLFHLFLVFGLSVFFFFIYRDWGLE